MSNANNRSNKDQEKVTTDAEKIETIKKIIATLATDWRFMNCADTTCIDDIEAPFVKDIFIIESHFEIFPIGVKLKTFEKIDGYDTFIFNASIFRKPNIKLLGNSICESIGLTFKEFKASRLKTT